MSVPTNFKATADLLAKRVILVTGASSGLGRALSLECARAGATVVLCGRSQAKLAAIYDEIEALRAPQPAIVQLDMATATAVDYDALAATVGKEFGRLDGLVRIRPACSAIDRPSNNMTYPPGAGYCTSTSPRPSSSLKYCCRSCANRRMRRSFS